MLAIVSDTHATEGHRLTDRTLAAVRDADVVVHAGDFMTGAVVDAFEREAARLVGVVGNNDDKAVRERFGETAILDHEGLTAVVAHGHRHDRTQLSMLARQEAADLVVVGHSHKPGVERLGEALLVNPGSHADPRWHRPGHAELRLVDGEWRGELLEPDGTEIRAFGLGGPKGRDASTSGGDTDK